MGQRVSAWATLIDLGSSGHIRKGLHYSLRILVSPIPVPVKEIPTTPRELVLFHIGKTKVGNKRVLCL